MTQDGERGERAAVEGDGEDRISGLPRNVKDHILELLPVQDAARTSILSRNWRYIWATLPNLVLDYDFCCELIEESESKFKLAVDEILLLHMGNIVKFILDISGAHLSSRADIDRWVLFVTRNGVKKLTVRISNLNTYTLPPSIFRCSTLTHLVLTNCVLKPPSSFLGFPNLITLDLKCTTFVPTTSFCVIKAPFLENLSLKKCHGTQYLNIVSPGLEVLHLDSYCLKILSAFAVPNGLPFTLNFLRHLSLCVAFDHLVQTYYAIQLIKNSPNLRKLVIRVSNGKLCRLKVVAANNAEAVLEYLDSPTLLERPLDKLEHVSISCYESAKAELCFAKQLLSRTPSLLRMCIGQRTDFVGRDITLELMRFPRASPRAVVSCFFFN